MLNIVTVDFNPTVGDVENNIVRILEHIKKISNDGQAADIIVFPELATIGYPPQDLIFDKTFIDFQDSLLENFKNELKEINPIVILGFAERIDDVSHQCYNSLMAIQNGRVLGTYKKQLLPVYDVFDEKRHFVTGPSTPENMLIVNIKGHKIGFVICEDAWNDKEALRGFYEDRNPLKMYDGKIDTLCSINASPYVMNKDAIRKNICINILLHHKLETVIYCNQYGCNDELIFDGESFVISKSKLSKFTQSIGSDKISYFSLLEEPSFFKDYEKENESLYDVFKILCFGIKDYARKCGFEKIVIGVSGGIDSALVLTMAVEAMGAENVAALYMPSDYNSEQSLADVKKLCDNLEIILHVIPIQRILAEELEATIHFGKRDGIQQNLARQNIQARTRGLLLMAYSNEHNALLLTTGNKSEVAVGYCTLYGDTNGGLNPIGDLLKTEVFEMCRQINQRKDKEIIPISIIKKAPSAELKPNQKDQDDLPPYELLDQIIKLFVLKEDSLKYASPSLSLSMAIRDKKITIQQIADVLKRIYSNEFKRKQCPPILKVSDKAFGGGRKMPIVQNFNMWSNIKLLEKKIFGARL